MHSMYGAAPSRHKALNETLARLSGELGLPTPRLFVAKRFPEAFGGAAPNMMANLTADARYGNAIVMTESYLDLFKCNPHSGEVPAEICASLGHELGHCKQGFQYLNAVQRYPLLVGPVAGMAALYLYDRAVGRHAQPTPEAAAALIDAQAQRETAALEAAGPCSCGACNGSADMQHTPAGEAIAGHMRNTQKSILEAGRYAAAAALGLAGGGLVTRNLMLELEYDADRTGALLAKDPQAMIRSLKSFEEYLRAMPQAEQLKQLSAISITDILKGLTVQAHPATELRIARLERMCKDPAAHALQAVQHLA